MGKATIGLIKEHEAIKHALNILELLCQNTIKGAVVEKNDLLGMIKFIKEFADKCHHGKEEQYLFEALVESGMSKQSGPIAVMLHEHDLGRALVKNMEIAVNDFEIQRESFQKYAMNYILLLRNHIEKENNLLFKMADDRLSDSKQDKIFEDFERYEDEVIGAGKHEELHQLLNSLSKKYSI
jgi:hemerythrin-like domain-containing protein